MARLLSTAGGYCQPQLDEVVDREKGSIIFLKAHSFFNNKKTVFRGFWSKFLNLLETSN
jgi:hypothetical protein